MEETKNRFINRDLSWLMFNERVLNESHRESNPVLERARFLAIAFANLDEFIMVRYSGLKKLADSGYNKMFADGFYPAELLEEMRQEVAKLKNKIKKTYAEKILPQLAENKINIRKIDTLNAEQKKYIKKYFETTVFPVVTPMAVDQGHPFPVLTSKTLAFAVGLTRYEKEYLAIVPVPKILPKTIKLPSVKDEFDFILIEELIRHYLDLLFKGYKINGSVLFRILRDSELYTQEEFAPDLLKAIEVELKKRSAAKIISFEAEKNQYDKIMEGLSAGLEPEPEALDKSDAVVDCSYLFELASACGRPELAYRQYVPAKINYENIFERIKEGNFITHLPYQSFYPTTDLIYRASMDPDVLAIKMTLYRSNEDSVIIKSLKAAAKSGKQVTVLIEIKARFDEERNIDFTKGLEDSGCHVIYGIANLKVHSKMALIVRREENSIKRYVHLSTGNYNEKTAKVYTDIGFFTCNDDFARDISDMFNVITGYSMPQNYKRVVSAPSALRGYFAELIDKEIEFQKKYKNGYIFAKMNSLEDIKIIEKLYEASSAGVKIKLIVRGICCLCPGNPDWSKNIELKSIVGRFLEHTRIFIFGNNSKNRVFLSSADWMQRNLDKRVELLFEMNNDNIIEHLKFVMDAYWKDTAGSHTLTCEKKYTSPTEAQGRFNAQRFLIEHYLNG